jgi:hypothetical protein
VGEPVTIDAGSLSTRTDHSGAPVVRFTAKMCAPALSLSASQPSPVISSLPSMAGLSLETSPVMPV